MFTMSGKTRARCRAADEILDFWRENVITSIAAHIYRVAIVGPSGGVCARIDTWIKCYLGSDALAHFPDRRDKNHAALCRQRLTLEVAVEEYGASDAG